MASIAVPSGGGQEEDGSAWPTASSSYMRSKVSSFPSGADVRSEGGRRLSSSSAPAVNILMAVKAGDLNQVKTFCLAGQTEISDSTGEVGL
jgi:hypothetical protein